MAGGTAPGHLGDLLADGSARGDVVGVAMRVEDLGTVNGTIAVGFIGDVTVLWLINDG